MSARRLGALAVLALVTGGCSADDAERQPSESGDSVVVDDPADDVVSSVVARPGPLRAAPDQPAVDVRRLEASHGNGEVRVELTVADLPARSGTHLVVHLGTPGADAPWKVGLEPRTADDPVFLGRPEGGYRRCPVEATWDADADRVTARIPTECLGDPAWVRVGAELQAGRNRVGATYLHDTALVDGDTRERWESELLPLTRRLSAG